MKYFILILLLPFAVLSASAHTLTETGGAIMHMTDSSYEPKDLTITVGDTVTFENAGLEDKWPASNIHPTHAIYPEFDPQRPIPPGESWSFTFSKVGVWKYHDHLTPTLVGTITVNDTTGSTATTPPSVWTRIKTFFVNLYHRLFGGTTNAIPEEILPPVEKDATALFSDKLLLKSYVKTFGPNATVQRLHALSAQFGDCHQPAHLAGRFAYELFNEKAFQTCSAECHSGCYHGATEAYFNEHGTADFAKNIGVICGPITNPFFNHQCIHGIGHGLTAWSSYDLPEALKGCDQLPNGKESCYSGVFMENIVGGLAASEATGDKTKDEHITTYLSADPQFPCTAVEEQYKNACYFYQTSRMVQLFAGDFSKVAAACNAAPKAYQSVCFQSMGRDVDGVNRTNPKQAIKECANAPAGSLRRDCLTGAVQDTFWDPSGQDLAISFCSLLTDREEKQSCYDTILSRASQVLPETSQRTAFCTKVEPAFRQACQNIVAPVT